MKLREKLNLLFGDTVGSINEVSKDVFTIESFEKKVKLTRTPLQERRFKPLYKVESNNESRCFNDFSLAVDYIEELL